MLRTKNFLNATCLTALGLFVLATLAPISANAAYTFLWEVDFYLPGDGLPASYVGDLDGDGDDELIGRYANTTRIIDLKTGAIEWTSAPYQGLSASITLMDIDGDTFPEAILLGDQVTYVVDWVATAAPAGTGADPDHAD